MTGPDRPDVLRLQREVEEAYRAGERKPIIRAQDYPSLTLKQAMSGAAYAWRQLEIQAAFARMANTPPLTYGVHGLLQSAPKDGSVGGIDRERSVVRQNR